LIRTESAALVRCRKKNHTEADKGIEPQYLHHVHRPLSEQLDPKKASREIKTHSGRGAK